MSDRIDRSTDPEMAPDEEATIRAKVREMYADPEGRKALDWLCSLSPAKFEVVVGQRNEGVTPDRRMDKAEIRRIFDHHIT